MNFRIQRLALATLFLAGICGQASAVCSDSGRTQIADPTALTTALSGNIVCVGSGPIWQNQEIHQPGGTLTDYKMGLGDPVDPTKNIGTWGVSGTGTDTVVTYNYTGVGVYTFKVFNNGTDQFFAFCEIDGTTVNTVGKRIVGGLGPCV